MSDETVEEQNPTYDREFFPYDPLKAEVTEKDDEGDVLLDKDGNKIEGFDERYRQDFQGLVFVGALSSRFRWLGHEFVINTLSMDDLIMVGDLIREYRDSRVEQQAYQTAVAGMCVTTIDGQPLTAPLGSGGNWHFDRYNYARTHWMKPVINKIYSEYVILEARVRGVIDAMEKASGLA